MKRATPDVPHHIWEKMYFNPRPREEGDGTAAYSYFVLGYFNPRPREEGDEVIMDYNKMINIFQSTPS